MSRLTYALAPCFMLSVLFAAAGCQEPQKDDGQEHNAEAERMRALEDQLSQAERDRIANENRLRDLQAELDRMRDELSKASEPGPKWRAVPGGAMTSIEGTILFDSGKAELKTTARGTLNAVAAMIVQKFPDHNVYVFGHTDNEPIRHSGWKDNYELSTQRALSVLRFLRGQGVTADLCAGGWGEFRPVADNGSAKSRQMNRRVEIYAMEKEASGLRGSSASAAFPAGR